MITVRAQAPASIGNFSVGFDVLGVALDVVDGESLSEPLGDVVEISASPSGQHQLEVNGKFAAYLPEAVEENLVWQCLQAFEARCEVPPLKIILSKNLPIASGLGSSACSIVAAAAALNTYLNDPLSAPELLELCGQLEGGVSGSAHLDNVAPSLLGGLVFCDGKHSCLLPFNPDWRLVVAYSGQEVSTRSMREVLPDAYPANDVIRQMTVLGSFINALHTKNWSQAEACLIDYLAEPRRANLISGFSEAKSRCISLGATAVGISGSGPTLFALCTPDTATAIAGWLRKHYVYSDQAFTRICKISNNPVLIERIKSNV